MKRLERLQKVLLFFCFLAFFANCIYQALLLQEYKRLKGDAAQLKRTVTLTEKEVLDIYTRFFFVSTRKRIVFSKVDADQVNMSQPIELMRIFQTMNAVEKHDINIVRMYNYERHARVLKFMLHEIKDKNQENLTGKIVDWALYRQLRTIHVGDQDDSERGYQMVKIIADITSRKRDEIESQLAKWLYSAARKKIFQAGAELQDKIKNVDGAIAFNWIYGGVEIGVLMLVLFGPWVWVTAGRVCEKRRMAMGKMMCDQQLAQKYAANQEQEQQERRQRNKELLDTCRAVGFEHEFALLTPGEITEEQYLVLSAFCGKRQLQIDVGEFDVSGELVKKAPQELLEPELKTLQQVLKARKRIWGDIDSELEAAVALLVSLPEDGRGAYKKKLDDFAGTLKKTQDLKSKLADIRQMRSDIQSAAKKRSKRKRKNR